jgi:N-methylhydantoinase B
MRNDSIYPLQISCLAGRDVFSPSGLLGGEPGRKREVLVNGTRVDPKGRYELKKGDVLTTLEAGGGGFGDKSRRPVAKIRADVRSGLVSPAKALEDYGASIEVDR